MTYSRKRPLLDPCPLEEVLGMVSGKWKVRVLYLLSLDDLTFGEMRTAITHIRQQVLSCALSDFISDAIVSRTNANAPGDARYVLTEKGHKLVSLLMPLADWGNDLLREKGVRWDPPQISRSRRSAPYSRRHVS